MSLDKDDSEYVTIGTALEIPEENETLKKTAKTEDQIVVDEKGRRRFHGAFTGGFSAGYFNTVGSKEGWTPSTFRSSRSGKQDGQESKKFTPEDFMDDEDFADHGIAPKKLQANKTYESTEAEVRKRKNLLEKGINQGEIHSSVPGGIPIDDLIMPAKLSIGIRLLKKMGWKPGQGVGEKIDINESLPQAAAKKVYGCSLPHDWANKENIVDRKSFMKMLAPKDVQPLVFESKDNFHGLGYSGLDPALSIFGGGNNMRTAFKPSGSEKKGIHGQAFGVGVFEDEDDDIYTSDALSNYDLTMADEDDNHHGWSGAPTNEKHKGCLKGFIKAKTLLSPPPPQMPIALPPDFVPRHVFDNDASAPDISGGKKLTSTDREYMLGEKEKGFSDINKWALKWDIHKEKEQDSTANIESTQPNEVQTKISRFSSRWDKDVRQERRKHVKEKSESSDKQPVGSSSNGTFQPFVKFPQKQARYEQFLKARKSGRTPEFHYDGDVTEWERERELEEFKKASVLYRSLSSAISSRFTRASIITSDIDDGKGDGRRLSTEKSRGENDEDIDLRNAAKSGMYGKLTRKISEWHPDKILCRRFNIKEPYPDSRIKGVPGRMRKTQSFFDDNYATDRLEIKQREEEKDLKSVVEESQSVKKLSTIKIGPLSHLNESKSDTGQENITPSNIDIVVETKEKPSIDIFKEIFDNSSESDSDKSDNETSKDNVKTSPTQNNKLDETAASLIHNVDISSTKNEVIDDKSTERKSNTGIINAEKDATTSSTLRTLPLSFLNQASHNSSSKVDSQTERKNMIDGSERTFMDDKTYNSKNIGREVNNTKSDERISFRNSSGCRKNGDRERNSNKSSRDKSLRDERNNQSETDSDWEETSQKTSHKKSQKSKQKKHKKRSHRKHSSKKSKKHKHRSRHSSTETENSSSDEEGLIPSNKELLEKLQKLSKRPSAADFM